MLKRCQDLVTDLKLGDPNDVTNVTPLTGGVASEIASIQMGDQQYCVKFALAKLKVAADWHAPVHRNAAEYAWLSVAQHVVPDSAVKLFGHSKTQQGFAMEFVAGDDVYLWKQAMLDGETPKGEAAAVGEMLGKVHQASTADDFDTSAFQNRDDFHALRIEPYLLFTVEKHPDIPQLKTLADMLYASNSVLVHGDVSPKNILFRSNGPIVLDAECATMGDASFDIAFCLNHLMLKAVHVPAIRQDLLDAALDFWAAYAPHITWEDAATLEARSCHLLAALMLARVDGKSPVEYLSAAEQERVRQLAIPLIHTPISTIQGFVNNIKAGLKDT